MSRENEERLHFTPLELRKVYEKRLPDFKDQAKLNLQDQIEDYNAILGGINNSKESQSSDSEDAGARKDQKILIDLSSEEMTLISIRVYVVH